MTENILDRIAREVFGERVESTQREEKKTPQFDLKKPPGFVGEICDYINSQSRYPREHLACISAIVTVGNMGAMKYKADTPGTGSNLFAFCVAGSTTGKEAILQAVSDIHIEAGISPAMHGRIRSDKDLIDNLLRHQASFYAIDEIGIELRKIVNSGKSGGATYLQSVIGTLMSIYSKSNGNYLLSGSVKTEALDFMQKEYQAESKRDDVDENRLAEILKLMNDLDVYGLSNPFLSLIGFTTPSTFNEIVTFEQITAGLIGRSSIVNEPDTNPKRKRGFVRQPMSDELKDKILYFCATGETERKRIEQSKHTETVVTDPDALEELEIAADWFEDEAEKHTERTGFEPVVRRGYEMVDKISYILGMHGLKRTLEHVKWSVEYVQRDIEYKTILAYSNVKEKSDPIESMAAKIMCSLDDNGLTIGRIVNKYRANKQVVEDAITWLETKGKIRTEYKKVKYCKNETKFIYKA